MYCLFKVMWCDGSPAVPVCGDFNLQRHLNVEQILIFSQQKCNLPLNRLQFLL